MGDALSRVRGDVHLYQPAFAGTSNACVVGSDDGVVCVDALERPSLAAGLRRASEYLGPVRLLILTHYHGDHVLGASALGARETLAHVRTVEALERRGAAERDGLAARSPEFADEYLSAPVPEPGTALDTALRVSGSSLEVLPVGPAHTDGDLVVVDHASQVVITGDVVVCDHFPVLRDADTRGWLRALAAIQALSPETVVPGHGPAAPAACIGDMIDLLTALWDLAADLTGAGVPPERVVEHASLPPRFAKLKRTDRFAAAMRHIASETLTEL